MKYNEIIALLDKGFTPEYIMNMGNDSENSDNSPDDPSDGGPDESGQKPDGEPSAPSGGSESAGGDVAAQIAAALKPVTDSMNEVLKEMQAANIMASRQQGDDKTVTAEDALASIIMPPAKK